MRLLVAVAVALVCGAVVAGLLVVGGPGEARKVAADRERLRDLRQIAESERCRRMAAEEKLLPRCRGATPANLPRDPATGAPYDLREVDDTAFDVCAIFESDPVRFGKQTQTEMIVDGQLVCLRYFTEGGED